VNRLQLIPVIRDAPAEPLDSPVFNALYNTPQVIDAHPSIRPTMADIYRAEQQVIAAFKELHGAQHEPGAAFVREAALKLLADEAVAP